MKRASEEPVSGGVESMGDATAAPVESPRNRWHHGGDEDVETFESREVSLGAARD
jgi:hypothetical protein